MRFSLALLAFCYSCVVIVLSGRTFNGKEILQRELNRSHDSVERHERRTCTPASTRKIREWWLLAFSPIIVDFFFTDSAQGVRYQRQSEGVISTLYCVSEISLHYTRRFLDARAVTMIFKFSISRRHSSFTTM